jgi:type I restriction enzyme S subunit
MATNQGFKSFVPNTKVLFPKYLYWWLKAHRAQLDAMGSGATFKEVSKATVSRVEIPLPPLEEQMRIAAILDKADELRAKRRQAVALLESLTRSIFLEMFGDPVSNLKGLPKMPLGELIKVSSGNGLTASQMDNLGIYSVYGGNGINGNHSAYMFEESQVAIGRVGVYCGAVHVTKPMSWITDNALYIKQRSKNLRLRYLAEALRMADLNQYAGRAAQPLISGSRIYPVEIMVPSISQQLKFEELLLSVENSWRLVEKSQHSIENTRSSLQYRAFTGQL